MVDPNYSVSLSLICTKILPRIRLKKWRISISASFFASFCLSRRLLVPHLLMMNPRTKLRPLNVARHPAIHPCDHLFSSCLLEWGIWKIFQCVLAVVKNKIFLIFYNPWLTQYWTYSCWSFICFVPWQFGSVICIVSWLQISVCLISPMHRAI